MGCSLGRYGKCFFFFCCLILVEMVVFVFVFFCVRNVLCCWNLFVVDFFLYDLVDGRVLIGGKDIVLLEEE